MARKTSKDKLKEQLCEQIMAARSPQEITVILCHQFAVCCWIIGYTESEAVELMSDLINESIKVLRT